MAPDDLVHEDRPFELGGKKHSPSNRALPRTSAKREDQPKDIGRAPRPLGPWRAIALLLILVAGAALSLLAYFEAQRHDSERIADILELRANWRAQDLKQKFEDASVPVEATADFLATHEVVTADEFIALAERARGANPVTRIAWAPWVDGTERSTFEANARQTISPTYSFTEIGDSAVVAAGQRNEYAPVLFERAFGDARTNPGFDYLSEPIRRAAALRARDEGIPVITDPAPPVFGAKDQRRLVLFWPIYKNDSSPDSITARRQAFRGFVVGIYVVHDLIDWAFKGTPDIPETLSLQAGDGLRRDADVSVAVYSPSTQTIDARATSLRAKAPGDTRIVHSFDLFGKRWTTVSDFPESFVSRYGSPARWLYLALGLTLTGLLFAYVIVEQRRRMVVEGIVLQRTKALQQSNDHLRRVQRIGRIGSLEIDLATKTVAWSDEVYRLLGAEPGTVEPAVGTFIAAAHPDDRARLTEAVDRNLLGYEVEPLSFRIVSLAGEVRWIERNADFARDDGGVPTTLIVTLYDITERKQMIEELRHSREHLTRAQRVGAIGSCEINLFTRETMWSEEMYRLWELDLDARIPDFEALADRIHPNDRALIAELDRMSLAGVETEPCDFRVNCGKGGFRWLNRQAVFIRDSDGSPISVIISNQDVTSRIEADNDLRQTKTLLAGIVESSEDAIISKSLDGTVTSWNAAAERMFGFSAQEILGRNILLLAPPGHESEMLDLLARIARGERVAHHETKRKRKDGAILDISLAVSPIYDGGGQIIGASKVARDITAIKEEGGRRQQLEAQLRQAQKMEAIGQLTGGVAHDFNNLLTVIVGRLELIESELDENSVTREWIRSCFNAARRGATLTRSLLSFSRKQAIESVVIDLGNAIDEVVALLPRTLGETIEVTKKMPPGLWQCEADPGQLQNALLNLAINARDAMPDGGRLTIEGSNTHLDADYVSFNPGIAEGDYVALSVTDSGCGMPPEVIARAFDPFFTTKEYGKGSGLGLSMVYGFAKQSRGHVKIYSEVGLGTTIRLYLPRCDTPSAAAPIPHTKPERAARQETILVVEDDDDMRALTVTQLNRLGYTAVTASNGADALKLLAEQPEIALLLTDLTLPGGLNGNDLAERAKERHPKLLVLFMSGYTEDAIVRQGRLAANARMLQKPFGIRDLAEQVGAALRDA